MLTLTGIDMKFFRLGDNIYVQTGWLRRRLYVLRHIEDKQIIAYPVLDPGTK